MGSTTNNTFGRALRHLKSTQIDEKISMLNETPTNNTSNLYKLEPDIITVDPDGTNPPDFNQDGEGIEGYTGNDTSGLFEPDGRIKVIEPPGDTSYILGPMASMWYAWGNFSTIGYIRQSDRRMVNLARITGRLGSWDGESNFTSYGQLTLAQAQWFKDTPKLNGADNDTPNYRAFYPGPPSNTPDEFGRYLCTITGTPKPPKEKKEFGKTGNEKDAGFPWGNIPDSKLTPEQKKKKREYLEKLKNKPPGTHTPEEEKALIDAGLDDFVKGGNTASPLGDLALLGLTAAAVKGAMAFGIGALLKGISAISLGSQVKPLFGDANNASDYNKQLGGKLVSSILSGQPQEIKLSDAAKADQINNVNPQQFGDALTFGPAPKPSAETTINPGNKKPVFTGDWGAQGGSEVHYDPKTDTLTFTSEKTLRTSSGGNTVTRDPSGKITNFSDIPSPPQEKVNDITRELLGNGIVDNLLGGLGNVMSPVTGGQNAWDQIKSNPTLLNDFVNNLSTTANNIATGGVQGTASNTVALRDALTKIGVPQSEVEKIGGGYGQVYSQTSYSGDQIPPELRNVINSKMPRTSGGYSISQPKPYSSGGFKVVGEETKLKRIIRDVKKPVVVKETKQEKIKRRPKVIGAPPRTINSDLMKQAEVPTSFKKPEDKMWGKYEKEQNARASQERKNVVLDYLGNSDQAWEYLLDRNTNKRKFSGYFDADGTPHTIIRKEEVNKETLLFIQNEEGKKQSILQSQLNEKLDEAFSKELFDSYFAEQETVQADNDPLFKKVKNVLKKQIDYEDKPSKSGYPNEEPPKMVNGWHPDYAKDKGYYNKLDPHSARAMPLTGNSEIDAKVEKAKKLKPVKAVVPGS